MVAASLRIQAVESGKLTKTFWHTLSDAGWRLSKKESQDMRTLSKSAINATMQVFRR
jgi:hypothetical protein